MASVCKILDPSRGEQDSRTWISSLLGLSDHCSNTSETRSLRPKGMEISDPMGK